MSMLESDPDDRYQVCETDLGLAMDHMSFKSKSDSFRPFTVDTKFVRNEQIECSYCDLPAVWLLVYRGVK